MKQIFLIMMILFAASLYAKPEKKCMDQITKKNQTALKECKSKKGTDRKECLNHAENEFQEGKKACKESKKK